MTDQRSADRLDTERLVLRPLDEGDVAFVVELLNDPDFLRYIGDRGVRTEEDARRYIREGPVASYARHGFGLLGVEPKETGRLAGICGLLKRDALEDVDVGFAFLPAQRGRGLALESARAVLDDARERLHLGRVVAITTPDNVPSITVLEKLGFAFERMVNLGKEDLRLYGRAL